MRCVGTRAGRVSIRQPAATARRAQALLTRKNPQMMAMPIVVTPSLCISLWSPEAAASSHDKQPSPASDAVHTVKLEHTSGD